MAEKKPSTFLDVDPSIIENRFRIASSANPEDEFRNLFTPPETGISIKPIPGFCLKTRDSTNNEKVFINICHSPEVPGPVDITEAELTKLLDSEEPSSYRVPLSIGECHTEKDNAGQSARVYDILISSAFLRKIRESQVFNLFFLTLVFEGLMDKFDMDIDVGKYVIMKNKKHIGTLHPHFIKNREMNVFNVTTPLVQEIPAGESQQTRRPRADASSREMEYHIIREPAKGRVKYLIGEFKIDRSLTAEDITLDVGEDRIIVETIATNQLVDVFVPFIIKQDSAKAVLNQNTCVLTVTMVATDPIIPLWDKEPGILKT